MDSFDKFLEEFDKSKGRGFKEMSINFDENDTLAEKTVMLSVVILNNCMAYTKTMLRAYHEWLANQK